MPVRAAEEPGAVVRHRRRDDFFHKRSLRAERVHRASLEVIRGGLEGERAHRDAVPVLVLADERQRDVGVGAGAAHVRGVRDDFVPAQAFRGGGVARDENLRREVRGFIFREPPVHGKRARFVGGGVGDLQRRAVPRRVVPEEGTLVVVPQAHADDFTDIRRVDVEDVLLPAPEVIRRALQEQRVRLALLAEEHDGDARVRSRASQIRGERCNHVPHRRFLRRVGRS